MQQVFKVRLSDGTETFVNDRLLDSLEERRLEEEEANRNVPVGTPSAQVDCCQGSGCKDWRWCGQFYIGSDACPNCGGMTRTNHHGQWCATCEWSIRTDNKGIGQASHGTLSPS